MHRDVLYREHGFEGGSHRRGPHALYARSMRGTVQQIQPLPTRARKPILIVWRDQGVLENGMFVFSSHELRPCEHRCDYL